MLFSTVQTRVLETKVLSNTKMVNGDNINASNITKEKKNDYFTTLRVALFPYIPDSGGDNYAGLLQLIKTEFERAYPGYKLKLRALNQSDDFYNLTILKDWLTRNDDDGYDLVEVDTVLLGDIVGAGIAAPVSIAPAVTADWHPSAVTAIKLNEAYYAYPHLQCAFFLFTRGYNPSKARTIDELVVSLGNSPTSVHRLVGNLNSSWDLPAIWIDSLRDTYPYQSQIEAEALHAYTKYTFDPVRQLARLCDVNGIANPCIDGTFQDTDKMTDLFAQGQANAMFGYSERLFRIIKYGFWNDINNVKAIPLPTGTLQNNPTYFTDAFVFRRNMPLDVEYAGALFAQFMATPRMQAVVVGSGDNLIAPRIPRYLLPVSKMAYDDPLISSDPFYQLVFRNLNGVSYPNTGFPNTREELQQAITNYIQ